jgi:hypothetical protein
MSLLRARGRLERPRNPGLLSLVVLIVVGVGLYIPVSPGPYQSDLTETFLPLTIAAVLLAVIGFIWMDDDRFTLDDRLVAFGWLGALIGGIVGLWLAIEQLLIGSSFAHVYGDSLSILSIGSMAGVLVGAGIATIASDRASPDQALSPESVVTESTWTNRSGPSPITTELVEQLSDIDGVESFDVEPLHRAIDPEVFRMLRVSGDSPWQLLFYASGYPVRVSSHGTITVGDDQPPTGGPAAEPETTSSGRRERSPQSGGAAEHDRSTVRSESPFEMVTEAIAEREQVSPDDLPAVEEWVHPATLETLTTSREDPDHSIEFEYLWYRVTVRSDGEINLHA